MVSEEREKTATMREKLILAGIRVIEENGVSGIWLRREWSIFLITVEPFRIAYSEIEETKVKGMGTGSLFLKVRGQWKPVPVERGREVKERIDRRRAAG